jgi:two-component system NtrC family sensor kinase
VGKGTGLGLSVCHGIIAEHNGRIYAESEPGKGATFIVELPIVPEEKQPEMAQPVAPSKRVTGARILVVDDEQSIRDLLTEVLAGHKVDTVGNASDALDKIKSEKYDVILLDIKMPGKSGIELYEEIEELDRPLAGRVIFVTGDVMGLDTREFFSRTKACYITKPFHFEELDSDINRMLAQAI